MGSFPFLLKEAEGERGIRVTCASVVSSNSFKSPTIGILRVSFWNTVPFCGWQSSSRNNCLFKEAHAMRISGITSIHPAL